MIPQTAPSLLPPPPALFQTLGTLDLSVMWHQNVALLSFASMAGEREDRHTLTSFAVDDSTLHSRGDLQDEMSYVGAVRLAVDEQMEEGLNEEQGDTGMSGGNLKP